MKNPRVATSGVFLFLILREGLGPQAGYRLFIAVQPFDDVVAGYTTHNSDQERNKYIHKNTPFLLPV